jgi:hypothetical protein
MMLSKTFILAALASLAPAAVVAQFIVIASAPGTKFDQFPVVASGNQFWVGGDKQTYQYCPSLPLGLGACVPSKVPPRTVFIGNGALSLAVTVPGGQNAWVSKSQKGALIYNTAHSTGNQGADDAGAKISQVTGNSKPSQLVIQNGKWLACLASDKKNYQVFAFFKKLNDPKLKCVPFTAQIWSTEEWQH